MHEHITLKQQHPTQKFHKNLKNPKNFQKPQNLGLKCMKNEKWGFKNTYQVIEAWSRPKIMCLEWERTIFCWERMRKVRSDLRLNYI